MPVWALCTAIWDKPVWRPRISRKPTTSAIVSANGYRISALYYQSVTGELEQATQVYELWAKSYPQDSVPPVNLGYIYGVLGQYEKSLADTIAEVVGFLDILRRQT